MVGETLASYAPMMKERYKNPVISQMLSKLRRNDRPKRHRVRTGMKRPVRPKRRPDTRLPIPAAEI